MKRRSSRQRESTDTAQRTMILALATGLLSLRPTSAFVTCSLDGRGLRRRACGASSLPSCELYDRVQSTRTGIRRGLQVMSGVAEEEAVGTKGTSPEVVGGNMKPFVTVPRREPSEWFEAVKAQAAPRPEALLELSK